MIKFNKGNLCSIVVTPFEEYHFSIGLRTFVILEFKEYQVRFFFGAELESN